MTEIELTAKSVIDTIADFADSYTYIEESASMLRIGLNKEFVNIRALSLLYEILHERIPNVIWGDIERLEDGMRVNLILGQNNHQQ